MNRVFCLFSLLLASCATAATLNWKSGISTDLAFETSTFLKATAHRKIEKVAFDVSTEGAYGPVNRNWEKTSTGKWFIEEQREASEAIAAGISYGNVDAIERGIKILEWGFQRQQSDGSFDCPDQFHSTSFFLESAAHSILLLEASAIAAKFSKRLDAMKPKALRAALWMVQPSVEIAGKKKNEPYTHRAYLVAAALGEVGVLTGNRGLLIKSEQYIREGLSRQDPSGFNPEKNGFDSSYHAVGLRFAIRYLVLCASPSIKTPLEAMTVKAIAWLKTRILVDGTVNASGNTRTGADQETGRNGVAKGISYGSVYRVLKYWEILSGDRSNEDQARKVYEADQRLKKRG